MKKLSLLFFIIILLYISHRLLIYLFYPIPDIYIPKKIIIKEQSFVISNSSISTTTDPIPLIASTNNNSIKIERKKEKSELIPEEKIISKTVLLDIPFTSQAPSAQWNDTHFQDGCEEASCLMIDKWIKQEQLTPSIAKKVILKITEFEELNYNNFIDTSAQDTAKIILKEYFNYQEVEVKKNVSLEDIKQEIFKGNAIIAPMNGQKLKNIYFTPPGPERHMLVIKGYDIETGEFITNDPGTKRGEGYRYEEKLFYEAICDYPTGNHVPIKEIKKNIILIKK